MKQIYKTITVILFLTFFATACNDPEEASPTIRLKTPAAEATFNLNEGNIRFEWQVTGVITGGYTLTLATDPTTVASKTYETPATSFTKEIPAEELDLLLKEWGYKANEIALIYWKVEATEGNADAQPLRPINIRRLKADPIEIALITPARNALIDLEATSGVIFEWNDHEEVSNYALEFSQQQDGDKLVVSVGTDINSISGNSITISSQGLTSMIESIGLTAPVSTFWWKVRSKTTNAPGVSESRKIRLIKIGAEELSPVSNLKAIPGNKRAKLTWDIDDPRITQVFISWVGGSKDLSVEAGTENMEVIIEGLTEGNHIFKLVSKDEAENVSTEVVANANVYSDAFSDGKVNRSLELVSLTRSGILVNIPKIESEYLINSELTYTNVEGSLVKMTISNDISEYLFTPEAMNLGTLVTLQSVYAPEAVVLDSVKPSLLSSIYIPEFTIMDRTKHAKVPDIAEDLGANASFGYAMLFDGITNDPLNMWHVGANDLNASGTANSLVDNPILITLDLGETANLSSLVTWGRYGGLPGKLTGDGGGGSYWAYGSYNFRVFEVWGSNVAPTNVGDDNVWKADGAWRSSGNWIKLTDCEVRRPSGCLGTSYKDEDLIKYPGAYPPNDEDVLAAVNGFEFAIPMDKPAVRYIRIVVTQTWDKQKRKRVSQGELSFYKYIPNK